MLFASLPVIKVCIIVMSLTYFRVVFLEINICCDPSFVHLLCQMVFIEGFSCVSREGTSEAFTYVLSLLLDSNFLGTLRLPTTFLHLT